VAILFFVIWPICILIDVAGAVVAVRIWRAGPPAPVRRATSIYVSVTVGLMALAFIAALWGILKGLASDDPSQKARVLAQGISEAMNCTAFAVLAATPLAIFLIIYAWVERSRRKSQ
jgi:hypothetical protein